MAYSWLDLAALRKTASGMTTPDLRGFAARNAAAIPPWTDEFAAINHLPHRRAEGREDDRTEGKLLEGLSGEAEPLLLCAASPPRLTGKLHRVFRKHRCWRRVLIALSRGDRIRVDLDPPLGRTPVDVVS